MTINEIYGIIIQIIDITDCILLKDVQNRQKYMTVNGVCVCNMFKAYSISYVIKYRMQSIYLGLFCLLIIIMSDFGSDLGRIFS